jgi:hypothetical protein
MLPDAGDRLKWTYGVSAFQQWCIQHNRSILSTNTSAGIRYFNSIPNYSRFFQTRHKQMNI